MEIKYTVMTVDKAGNKQVQLFEGTKKQKEGFIKIWELAYDPNNMTDLLIHKEIKK